MRTAAAATSLRSVASPLLGNIVEASSSGAIVFPSVCIERSSLNFFSNIYRRCLDIGANFYADAKSLRLQNFLKKVKIDVKMF